MDLGTRCRFLLCIVIAGCDPGPLDGAGPFYRAAIPEGADHGTLVASEEVESLAPNSRSFRVLYTSLGVDERPIPVSGLVVIPDGPIPAGGYDVVSWAHGTLGVTDGCVPSNGYSTGHDIYAIADEIVAEGWIAVATDYEGIGTPGVHPFLVGTSEGRGVVDIVRAVASIDGVQTSGRFAVWGHSQGGHAALFAAESASEYAPELDLVGTVAAAPLGDLILIGSPDTGVPVTRAFVWQLFIGMERAYADVALSDVLSPRDELEARRLVRDGVCNDDWPAVATDELERTVGRRDRWYARLEENSPGRTRLPDPLLIIQGTGDSIAPSAFTLALAEDLCATRSVVEYRPYAGESHHDATELHMPEIRRYTRDRFDRLPATSNCSGP